MERTGTNLLVSLFIRLRRLDLESHFPERKLWLERHKNCTFSTLFEKPHMLK